MTIETNSKHKNKSQKYNHSAIALKNDYLIRLQRIHLVLTNLIPLISFIAALFVVARFGINPINVTLLLSMYLLTILGITVGFHRYFCHEAFKTHKIIRILLAIIGSMAAQSPVIYWVAQHRRHHQFSDKIQDPHSPHLSNSKIAGLWHSHLGWVLIPEATNTSLFAKELIQDLLIYKISKLYYFWILIGLLIPALIELAFIHTWQSFCSGLLWGGLVRIFLVQQATFSINSICHSFGNKSFKTKDQSKNTFGLAILSGGESWHNNHHAFPNSARFGLQWWQIDLGYITIKILEFLGLAWNVKVPTSETIALRSLAS